MKKQKQIYVSPETETLVVRFEGVVCSSGGKLGYKGRAGADWDEGDDYNDYGDL